MQDLGKKAVLCLACRQSGRIHASAIILEFKKQYPGIELQVREAKSDELFAGDPAG